MLAVVIFAAIFNCLRASEYGDSHNRYKYVGTNDGMIRGHSAKDGDYLAFLGIPYAAPPVGNNRFKAPKPPTPWEGTYDAVRKVQCPQKGQGDEDCLVLNVFTPVQLPNHLLPVLVYIHGGSFLIGTAPTKGLEPLIKQNIIVVTINYRLGALGFLCLGIKDAPGNAGLKDQVAALRWVKNNIIYFGGKPDDVTIYGMSAGGASVDLLVLSRAAVGLFNKGIVESGSATSVWVVDANPIKTAQNVANLLDFPETVFMEILVEYYKNMDADVLSEINYQYYNNLTDGTFGFVPCVERKLRNVEPFIREAPCKILEKQKYVRLPMMFFFTTSEGLYLRSDEYIENNYKERMEKNFVDFMPANLVFDKEKFRNETADRVRHFYFENNPNIDYSRYLEFFGDYLILHGVLNSADAHAFKCNPVYLMEFAYAGGLQGDVEANEVVHVAGHGDVVKHVILNSTAKDERDKTAVRRVSTLIANFVKYGNPTPSQTPLLPISWPPVKPGNLSYLHFNDKMNVFYNPYEHRIALWDELYAKFRLQIKSVRPH